ncbi:hypothetical protein Emag_002972 [Eimeria magna]
MDAPSNQPGPGGADTSMDAMNAINDASVYPYFLSEMERQDAPASTPFPDSNRRGRRTVRLPSFEERVGLPNLQRRRPSAQRGNGSALAAPACGGVKADSSGDGNSKSKWLAASLDAAVQSSEALSLVNHLRSLASRLFSENANLKVQVQRGTRERQQPWRGRLHATEDVSRLARRLADENSFLQTFVTSDSRVLQTAELARIKKEHAAALEANRRLEEQRERDKQVIAELELKSRAFADAYSWLTSHNRLINARDAPALVNLWRQRVAEAGVSGKGPVVPEFASDLAAAYAAADSEGDTEAPSDDGRENEEWKARQLAAELREAEALSEAREALARAALAEQRAAEAEGLLQVTQAELERLQQKAAAEAAPRPVAASNGYAEMKLRTDLKASQAHAAAVEAERNQLATQLNAVKTALDVAMVEKQRAETEKASALAQAAAAAKESTQQREAAEDLKAAKQEGTKLKSELQEARKQCEELQAKLQAIKRAEVQPSKTLSPKETPSTPNSDLSTLTSERDSYKAAASRLEMELKQLKVRLDEAAKLEKTVSTLKGQAAAGQELQKAHAALQEEAETLRKKLDEEQKRRAEAEASAAKATPPKAAASSLPQESAVVAALTKEREALKARASELQEEVDKLQAENAALKQSQEMYKAALLKASEASSKASPAAAEEAFVLVKERDSLKERVAQLEDQLTAMRAAAAGAGKASPSLKAPLPSSKASQSSPLGSGPKKATVDAPRASEGVAALGSVLVTEKAALPVGKKAPVPSPAAISKAASDADVSGGVKAPGEGATPPFKNASCLAAKKEPVGAAQLKAGRALPQGASAPLRAASPSNEASTSVKDSASSVNAESSEAAPLETVPEQAASGEPGGVTAANVDVQPRKEPPPLAAMKLLAESPVGASAAAGTAGTAPGQTNASPTPGSSSPLTKGLATKSVEALQKEAKTAVPLLSKPPAADTKLAPPPKKAVAVEAASASAAPKIIGGAEANVALKAAPSVQPPVKSTKAGAMSLSKTVPKDTKVAAPPKKAQAVEAAPSVPPVEAGEHEDEAEKHAEGALPGDIQLHAKEAQVVTSALPKVAAKETKPPSSPKAVPTDAASPLSMAVKAKAPVEKSPVAAAVSGAQLPTAAPKTIPKDTKVAPPPKKAQSVEPVALYEETPAAESKEELEKEVTKLREQLAASEELKKAYEALQKETEDLRSQLKTSTLKVPPAKKAAPAATTGEAKDELEKENQRLREQLAASEELKKAHEALQKETEDLRSQLKTSTLKVPPAKKAAPAATTGEAKDELEKENQRLREQLAASEELKKAYEALQKETEDLRSQLKTSTLKVPPAKKAAPAVTTGEAKDELEKEVSKLREQLAASEELKKTHEALQKEVENLRNQLKTSTLKGPPAKKAAPAATKGETKDELEKEVSKLREQLAASEELKKAYEALQKETEDLRNQLKTSALKVPPAKKAAPAATTGEAKDELEKENQRLREQLAASEELKKAHEALQKETEDLRNQLKTSTLKVPPAKKAAPAATTGEAKDELEKEVTKLREQLAASEELKKAHEALQKETEDLRNQLKTSTLKVPPAKKAAPAAATGEAKDELEKENQRLREQLAASEELKKTHEALQKEVENLRNQLKTSTLKVPPAKKAAPAAATGEAKDELEKEVSKLREQLAASEELKKAHEALQKEVEDLRSQLKASTLKVPPAKKAAPVATTGEAKDELEKENQRLREQLAASEELKKTYEALQKETENLRNQLKTSTLKVPPAKKAAPAVTTGEAKDELEKEVTKLREQSAANEELKKAHDALQKEVENLRNQLKTSTLKVPPAKKAAPAATTGEAKDELEKENQRLREQLAASEELKKAHEALQKETDDLRSQLKTSTLKVPPAKKAAPAATTGEAKDELEKENQRLREQLAASEELKKAYEGLQKETDDLRSQLKTSTLKVPPAKKAAPAVTTGEAKDELEKEVSKLREQLAASEELKQERDALQKEIKGLRSKLEEVEQVGSLADVGSKGGAGKAVEGSEDVEQGGSAVRAELAKKEAELKEKEAALENSKKEAAEKDKLIQAKTEEVKGLQTKLETLEKEKAQVMSEKSALTEKLEAVQKELEQLKASGPTTHAQKEAELEKARESLSAREKALNAKVEEVKTLQTKLETLEKERADAINEKNAIKANLESMQKELEQLKASVSATASRAKEGEAAVASKTVKRSASITKRPPGPPTPALKADTPAPEKAAADGGKSAGGSATKKEVQALQEKSGKGPVTAQAEGTDSGEKKEIQAKGADSGVKKEAQAKAAGGGEKKEAQAKGADGGEKKEAQAKGSDGGEKKEAQAKGADGGEKKEAQAKGAEKKDAQAKGADSGEKEAQAKGVDSGEKEAQADAVRAGSDGEAASKKKKSSKKIKEAQTEDAQPKGSPRDAEASSEAGEAKKKKKKKKKAASSDEEPPPLSERESDVSHAEPEEEPVPASAGGWGFSFFGGGSPPATSEPASGTASPTGSNAARPSFLELIVGGGQPVEEPPKENDLPPLKLSTVEGADDQSDEGSSEDEPEESVASKIAGFFWGV